MRQLQILLLIFIAVFCLSACGNIPGSGEKIAYINWEEAVKAHPRHEALKQGQAEYDKLLAYRDQQADIAHKQISGLALLQKIKQNSCKKQLTRRMKFLRLSAKVLKTIIS